VSGEDTLQPAPVVEPGCMKAPNVVTQATLRLYVEQA